MTTPAEISGTVERLRATFRSGRTRPPEWRIAQLTALERLLSENEAALTAALTADLGRRPVDGWLADLAPVAAESRYARRHLHGWMRSRRVGMPLSTRPGRAWVQYESLGVVLVIGPWNYSGQTCIAPDYVLAHRSIRDEFLSALDAALTAFSEEPTLPIVNSRHAERLAGLLTDSGGTCVRGGTIDAAGKRAELAVVTDPDPDSRLMREEIFGPILPVLTIDDVDEAVEFVRDRPKPLTLYLFTRNRAIERRVLADVSSGGAVINHLMFHVLVTQLPFGGVGTSGTGAYHGRWGFETFSHRKSVLRKPTRPDPSIVYPPYTALKERLLRKVF